MQTGGHRVKGIFPRCPQVVYQPPLDFSGGLQTQRLDAVTHFKQKDQLTERNDTVKQQTADFHSANE